MFIELGAQTTGSSLGKSEMCQFPFRSYRSEEILLIHSAIKISPRSGESSRSAGIAACPTAQETSCVSAYLLRNGRQDACAP